MHHQESLQKLTYKTFKQFFKSQIAFELYAVKNAFLT